MHEIKKLLDTFTDVSFDLEDGKAKNIIKKLLNFIKMIIDISIMKFLDM